MHPIAKRFAAVVVLYAAAILLLAFSDAFAPGLGWYSVWLHSSLLKVIVFVVLWFAAPYILPKLSGKKEGEPPSVNR